MKKMRRWADRHPAVGEGMEAFATVYSFFVGLWVMSVVVVSAIPAAARFAGRTPARDAIVLGPVGRSLWGVSIVAGIVCALMFARYVTVMSERLPRWLLLPLCAAIGLAGVYVDVSASQIAAYVPWSGDNAWVAGILKLWVWATYLLAACPFAAWLKSKD